MFMKKKYIYSNCFHYFHYMFHYMFHYIEMTRGRHPPIYMFNYTGL